jgi:hypothetical protein
MCESGLYRDYSLVAKLKEIVDFYKKNREEYWETGGDGEWGTGGDGDTDNGIDDAWFIYDKAERLSKDIINSSVNLSLLGTSEELESFRKDYDEYIQLSIPKIKENIQKIYNYELIHGKYVKIDTLENLEKCRLQAEPLRRKIPQKFDAEQFPLSLIEESISIKLSLDFLDKIDEGASRVMDLFRIAICLSPKKPTKKFLDRVSNCYIWGFDSECVILCRSVIDTAFRDKITYEICESTPGKRDDNRHFTLEDRIIAAFNKGYIDENTKNMAVDIRVRGNKAIHDQPDITKNVFETIKKTMIVIERLYEK